MPALFSLQNGAHLYVTERGPLATVGAPRQRSEKSLEMKVYPDIDFYIRKPKITGK